MLATVESKNQAVSKLEALIERGRSRAANVIDHVMRNQPTDRLARGEALQFRAADNLPEILMTVPDREHGAIEQSLHRNAVYQMAQATDMPVKFIDSLQSVAEPWGRQLLAHNLQTVFNRRFQKKHYLLRSLQQEVRGFLSDSYRRIDSRPIVEAFAHRLPQPLHVRHDNIVMWHCCRISTARTRSAEMLVGSGPFRSHIRGNRKCLSIHLCGPQNILR
jgi:hypothetical protein